MARRLLLLLTLAGGLGCSRSADAPPAPAAGPASVLLVTVDTLRADRLGCYGDALSSSVAAPAATATSPTRTPTSCSRYGLNFDVPAGTERVNSARGESFSKLDLRVSKKFRLGGRLGAGSSAT